MDVIKTKLQTQNCFGMNERCAHCNLMNCPLRNSEHKTLMKDRKPVIIPNMITRDFVSGNGKNNNSRQHDSDNQRQKIIYKDIFSTIKSILNEEGLRGFTKGVVPRMLTQAPSAAISWSTYEIIKKYLIQNNRF